jgi:hypothetical protein
VTGRAGTEPASYTLRATRRCELCGVHREGTTYAPEGLPYCDPDDPELRASVLHLCDDCEHWRPPAPPSELLIVWAPSRAA